MEEELQLMALNIANKAMEDTLQEFDEYLESEEFQNDMIQTDSRFIKFLDKFF